MKCPNCDTPNNTGDKYCRVCGVNLQDNNTFEEDGKIEKGQTPSVEKSSKYPHANNDKNKSSSDWWLCCGCLIIIFIIFAIASRA